MPTLLLIKTSSLGDVIHTLPALTDLRQAKPDWQVDWLVEPAFAEIAAWHPSVHQVIPVALRRWRKSVWQSFPAWRQFRHELRQTRYNAILDAQGLLKSAWLALQAKGIRHGLDRRSAREPLASLCYQRRHQIARDQHAITRLRQLFATALDYEQPKTPPDYGLEEHFAAHKTDTVVFLHATTWPSKHWYLPYWQQLAEKLQADGLQVLLPWGNDAEHQQAQQIAEGQAHVNVLPKSNLTELAEHLASARVVVGVDTGLAHLAAAMNTPTVSLYTSTRPEWTGTLGKRQVHLRSDYHCSPCLRKHCKYPEHPIQPACVEQLGVQQALEAVRKLI